MTELCVNTDEISSEEDLKSCENWYEKILSIIDSLLEAQIKHDAELAFEFKAHYEIEQAIYKQIDLDEKE